MKKPSWRKKIRAACEEAGTYEPFFDLAIDQLAGIMEMRDAAQARYKAGGSEPVIEHTNKSGHVNVVKNPALVVINECNQQALAYWRDLGLTPSGFRKVNGEAAAKGKSGGGFEELLADIGI